MHSNPHFSSTFYLSSAVILKADPKTTQTTRPHYVQSMPRVVQSNLSCGNSHVGGLHMATGIISSMLHAWFEANFNNQFLPFVQKDSY